MRYTYKQLVEINIAELRSLKDFYRQPDIAKDYSEADKIEAILNAITAIDRKLTNNELDTIAYKVWQWQECKSCILHDRLRDALR